jgi:hypothetical protein
MTGREKRATRRKHNQRTVPPRAPLAASSGPARIPGVHIAHVGGRSAAIDPIRAYWQARGAVFLHHSTEPDEPSGLEEILARSHIVFHAGADADLGRHLERYCERVEKPLILLEENSVWALAKALSSGLSL